ncbi:MAG: hypothetical protein Q7R94_00140, partial [bacterium]|nr:hypothetical protein [bacterium]
MASEIVFASFLGFLAGIISAGLGVSFFNFASVLLVIFLSFLIFRKGMAGYVLVVILLFLAGNFYFHFYKNATSAGYPKLNSKVAVEALVVSEPSFSENLEMADVQLLSAYSGKIRLITDASKILRYGDKIKAEGTLLSRSK